MRTGGPFDGAGVTVWNRRLLPELSPAVADVVFGGREAQRSDPPSWTVQDAVYLADHRLAGAGLRLLDACPRPAAAAITGLLRERAFDSAWRTLRMLSATLPALQALDDAGVPYVVSKGPGLAAVYPSPVDRPYADLDVLVEPRTFPVARRILAGLGYRVQPQSEPPWDAFDRLCREGVNLYTAEGGSVDLHHRIPPWRWARALEVRDLLRRAERRNVSGTGVAILPALDNFVVSLLHVVSDRGNPGATTMVWKDIVTTASLVDGGEAAALLERLQLADWALWILSQVPRDAVPCELLRAIARRAPFRPMPRRLALSVPPSLGSRHLIGQPLRLPVPHDVLFVAGMIVPSRRFLATRPELTRPTYRAWWRRGVTGYWAARERDPALTVRRLDRARRCPSGT